LRELDPELLEYDAVLLELYALGDDLRSEGPADMMETLEVAPLRAVPVSAVHVAPIDLDDVRFQHDERLERAPTQSDVVDRDPAPGTLAQNARARCQHHRIADERDLIQLEAEPSGPIEAANAFACRNAEVGRSGGREGGSRRSLAHGARSMERDVGNPGRKMPRGGFCR
jgi:hypothetical protein